MRSLLLALLAVLLPLQFAWAGAAAYCAHEKASSTQAIQWHFGHHTHEHKTDADADAGDAHAKGAKEAKSAKLPDGDCNACHFPGSHGVFTNMRLTGDAYFVRLRYEPRVSAFGSIPSPVPDRPQWPGLA